MRSAACVGHCRDPSPVVPVPCGLPQTAGALARVILSGHLPRLEASPAIASAVSLSAEAFFVPP